MKTQHKSDVVSNVVCSGHLVALYLFLKVDSQHHYPNWLKSANYVRAAMQRNNKDSITSALTEAMRFLAIDEWPMHCGYLCESQMDSQDNSQKLIEYF